LQGKSCDGGDGIVLAMHPLQVIVIIIKIDFPMGGCLQRIEKSANAFEVRRCLHSGKCDAG